MADNYRSEAGMDRAERLEHRLAIAADLLGWTPARIAAFREGLVASPVDAVRLARHDADRDGFVESRLQAEALDALGYADGVRARRIDALPRCQAPADRDEMVAEGEAWMDQGSVEVDPGDLDWTFEPAASPDAFLGVMTREEWVDWFRTEDRNATEDGRPGYGDLLMTDIVTAVVHHVDADGAIDIWDGWHRIGACVVRGAVGIPRIYGSPPGPGPTP